MDDHRQPEHGDVRWTGPPRLRADRHASGRDPMRVRHRV